MNIEEALKELLAGKKIRRRGWESKSSYNIEDDYMYTRMECKKIIRLMN